LSLDARIGGSPFNVAVGLARLGQPAALVTQIAYGFLGDRLMQALTDEGVDTRAIRRTQAPTTLSLVGVDAQGVPSYAFYGEGAADRCVDDSVLGLIPAEVQAIHVGSYTTVVGQTAATQRRLIERDHHHRLVSYDPNIRLNVEPDPQAWRDQMEWMLLRRTHLLKVSEEDLGLVLPGVSPEGFARRALEQGVALVVVTRGENGALAWTAGEALAMPPVPTAVVDTVGAGDTFQAALLTALSESGHLSPEALRAISRAELERSLWFAARAASITCSRRGADLPRRAEV
jgi:fructokinase